MFPLRGKRRQRIARLLASIYAFSFRGTPRPCPAWYMMVINIAWVAPFILFTHTPVPAWVVGSHIYHGLLCC